MSKLNDLKTQNPNLNFNYIDAINLFCPKTKYVELFVNLFKNDKTYNQPKNELINVLTYDYGFEPKLFDNIPYIQLINYYRFFNEILGSNIKIFREFIDFNERNLIEKNDLTTYKSFDELNLQVSLANIKNDTKIFESQIIKLYEDDEWLVIKPLSFESSKKYGANTKWCTTSEGNSDYFFRYIKNGILIYTINKNTGNKTAIYKDFNSSNNDVSFWDMMDNRIDSIFADLSEQILNILKLELKTCEITNWGYLTEEDKVNYTKKYVKYEKSYEPDIQFRETALVDGPADLQPNPERVVRYEFNPPVPTERINVNIRVEPEAYADMTDIETQVQASMERYIFQPNTPSVREEIATTLLENFNIKNVYFD